MIPIARARGSRGVLTAGAAALLVMAGCAGQPGSPPVVDRTTDAGTPRSVPAAAPELPRAQPLFDGLPPDGHVVQAGDTLYGIAWRYGLDYRTIAQLNGIAPPYRILVGQRLQLAAPGAADAPGAAVAGAPAPAMIPAEPSSRGFEFVPESAAGAGASATQPQEAWQDMPPPTAAAPGVAIGTPGPAVTTQALPPPVGTPAPAAAPAGPLPATEPYALPPPGAEPPAAGATTAPAPAAPFPGPSTAGEAAAAGAVAVLPQPAPAAEPAPPAPVEPEPVAPPSQPEPVAALPPSGGAGWRWPTGGSVQKGFGNGNKGIDFKLTAGEPVVAAGAGEVVYAGNGLGGFRHLVIVKHDQRFLSAYSLNRPIVVKEGERVAAGGTIAAADAASGGGTLRFEIRRDGQPVDPAGVIGR